CPNADLVNRAIQVTLLLLLGSTDPHLACGQCLGSIHAEGTGRQDSASLTAIVLVPWRDRAPRRAPGQRRSRKVRLRSRPSRPRRPPPPPWTRPACPR